MENFGSEVGQKMRSAVKAKLIELGTGGSAGYIDDELPDYVMIMVANKRSKEQMIADLNLFLGDHTELFVTWLHEVLQKLQEVTLPTTIATARKRKNVEKDEIQNKKDKKANKRDKKNSKKSNEKSTTENPTSIEKTAADEPDEIITICSITDVFAEEFLQKAKKTTEDTVDALNVIKKNKNKNNDDLATSSNHTQKTNEFDIPTISEISSTTETGNRSREEDLAELAKIQQQIYIAKKQLKYSGELDKNVESEDEDFLNLKDDGSVDEFAESEDLPPKSTRKSSPIVFETPNENVEDQIGLNNSPDKSHCSKNTEKQCLSFDHFRNMNDNSNNSTKRRPVRERLGIVSHISRNRITTKEQKLAFERNIQNHLQRNTDTNKSNERRDLKTVTKHRSSDEHNNARIFKLALPENNKESSEKSSNTSSHKNPRIGSRVIIAPTKSNVQNETDEIEKPVNSVIKIKPRPVIPAGKQACKNLLLRAMADAQRSTITTKSTGRKKTESKLNVRSNSIDNRNISLFSKSYRNKIKHSTGSSYMKSTQSFVIEVEGKWQKSYYLNRKDGSEDEYSSDEQYEPKSTTDKCNMSSGYIYVPKAIADDDIDYKREDFNDDEWNYISENAEDTQFVVTLNDKKKIKTRDIRNRSYSPIPQVTSSTGSRRYEVTSSSTSRSGRRSRSRSHSNQRQNRKNSHSYDDDGPETFESTSSCNTPPTLRRTELIETYRKPHQVKKIIIKNDSEDDMCSRKGFESYGETKDNTNNSNKISERSTTPPLPPKMGNTSDNKKDNEAQSNSGEARKHTLIKYDVRKGDQNSEEFQEETHKSSTRSRKILIEEKAQSTSDYHNHEESRKIVIRNSEAKKYDNIPSLNSVALNITSIKTNKPKERCKYHPNCTKQFCEFYHPSAACKSFPNCKFADKCIYSHPKCKFDISCTNTDCNFAHSGPRNCTLQMTAPPLSSHVIPVQNYKSISALPTAASATMCKFYPNCSKVSCTFYHPKPCRFGKNCINKLECNFYHHETQSSNKFKWVASVL